MRRFLATAAAAVAIVGLSQAPSSAAMAIQCTGTLTGEVDGRIVVPEGETCRLEGATVNGNVRILEGGALISHDSTVNGNVNGRGARTVRLIDTHVVGTGTSGNINLQATLRRIVIGAAGCSVDPAVGNNITLINNFGNIAICQMTTGETITLVGNSGLIGVHDNVVGNSLVVKGNTGPFTRVTDNEVGVSRGGSITFASNSSQVVVKRNSAANRFACSANDPTPIGSGNTAGAGLGGQCTLLG